MNFIDVLVGEVRPLPSLRNRHPPGPPPWGGSTAYTTVSVDEERIGWASWPGTEGTGLRFFVEKKSGPSVPGPSCVPFGWYFMYNYNIVGKVLSDNDTVVSSTPLTQKPFNPLLQSKPLDRLQRKRVLLTRHCGQSEKDGWERRRIKILLTLRFVVGNSKP